MLHVFVRALFILALIMNVEQWLNQLRFNVVWKWFVIYKWYASHGKSWLICTPCNTYTHLIYRVNILIFWQFQWPCSILEYVYGCCMYKRSNVISIKIIYYDRDAAKAICRQYTEALMSTKPSEGSTAGFRVCICMTITADFFPSSI